MGSAQQPFAVEAVSAEALIPGSEVREWRETLAHIEEASTYWLATVRRDGGPHLVPLLAVRVDGTLHFAASGTTRKAKSLAADPRCVVGVEGEGLDLVVEGEASKVRDEPVLRRVAEAYASRYEWHVTIRDGAFHDAEGAPTAGPPP